MKFHANNDKLGCILASREERFRIPRYQRPYSWTEDQINDFWNDLIASSKGDNYFLGSVILNYESYGDDKVVDIIDGQQRILTSTILLAVLRDITQPLDEELSNSIQRQSIYMEDGVRRIYQPRVEVGESAKEFFEKYIQSREVSILDSKPQYSEHRKILNNYKLLKEKVESELDRIDEVNKKIEWITNLYSQIDDLSIIKVRIESEEDAYEIFETTNARGVDLSVADLIKNVIFKNIPERGNRDSAKEKWSYIEQKIEGTGTEVKRFIRYYWISKEAFVSDKRLFRTIKQNTLNWEKFLDDLVDNSEKWDLILNSSSYEDLVDYQKADKLYASLNALKLMGVIQHNALLLSIFRNYKYLGLNPLNLIEFIEKFTFQYSAISKGQTNRVEKIYSRYARDIEDVVKEGVDINKRIQTVFHNIKAELKTILPYEEEFISNFNEVSYSKRELSRYILGRINNYLQKTNEHKIDYNNVNIEHILPQKPESDWGLKKSDIKGYVNKLGNLTLLDKRLNSKIQNTVLAKKIPHLRESELAITKKFIENLENSENPVWDEEQINNRQKNFAEIAYHQIWKI